MTLRPMIAALAIAFAAVSASAQPTFINGIAIPGATLDKTREPGANAGRLGFFSDLYYDPAGKDWWALSDRGPGGGVFDYQTRVQKVEIRIHPVSGEITKFKVRKTIKFTDPNGLLAAPSDPSIANPAALNGLNPLRLNGSAAVLGRSFDPEGLVINPRNGNLIVSDEYGPSVYEFDRRGRLLRAFETPANLLPRVGTALNYVADRAAGGNAGRQDNRGFEGLAITPDGRRLVAALQDPLFNEPGPNNGRDGRNVRIVVFDNDPVSMTYGKGIAQYAYPLEAQSAVLARIVAAGGTGSATDPRQGRNIGLSAIVAINDREFLVLERDNRGLGVDDPAGAGVTGSKRVYKIDISGATDVTGVALPGGDLAAFGITPVAKSALFIDLAANTVLPNGKKAEKWEGLAIGPKLKDGSRVIVAGTDNDYSVTQSGPTSTQYDVYADFAGGSVQRDIDQPTRLDGAEVGPVPVGYALVPGVLHAYRVPAADLPNYVEPRGSRRDDDEDGDERDDEPAED